jgi:hypothetical protein
MDFSYFTSGPQPYQFFGLPHDESNDSSEHQIPTRHDSHMNAYPSQLTSVGKTAIATQSRSDRLYRTSMTLHSLSFNRASITTPPHSSPKLRTNSYPLSQDQRLQRYEPTESCRCPYRRPISRASSRLSTTFPPMSLASRLVGAAARRRIF